MNNLNGTDLPKESNVRPSHGISFDTPVRPVWSQITSESLYSHLFYLTRYRSTLEIICLWWGFRRFESQQNVFDLGSFQISDFNSRAKWFFLVLLLEPGYLIYWFYN